MAKKLFPYITYIDAGSAQVRSDFDNTTLLATNFADVNYTLPDSSLVIMTNKTPDIPFNATVTYNYRILIVEESTDYVFEDLAFDAEMDEEQELDSTVSLNVSVVAADRNVVSVGTVSPS
jgi:hypothetical protein